MDAKLQYLSKDFLVQSRSICNTSFPLVLDEILLIFHYMFLPSATQHRDSYKQLKVLLNLMYNSQGFERAFYHPLSFIKQHSSWLRHDSLSKNESITNRDVSKTLRSLADLIVYLRLLNEIHGKETKHCVAKVHQFYQEYYLLAVSEKITVPVMEKFKGLDDEDSEKDDRNSLLPPQDQTISWYKKNGWREFLKQKVIIPNVGVWKGVECRIERFNGNNTRCVSLKTN
jgi:hypothetical protein